jgi:hypothetical protein
MSIKEKLFGDMTNREIAAEIAGGFGLLALICAMMLFYIAF